MPPEKMAANNSDQHLRELRRALDELKSGKIGIEEAKEILREISTYYEPEIKEEEARQAASLAAEIREETAEGPEETTGEAEDITVSALETADSAAAGETPETAAALEEATPETAEETVDAAEEAGKEVEGGTPTMQKSEETDKERLFREAVQTQRAEETEVFQGTFDVEISSPVDPIGIREFRKHLKMIPGVKIMLVSGTQNGGTTIVVSVTAPTTLISFIRSIPSVSRVNKTGSVIRVDLKNSK